MSNFKTWALDVAQRAVSTAAQAILALTGTNTAGWTHLSFGTVAKAGAGAALICILQHLSDLKGFTPVVNVPLVSAPILVTPTPVAPPVNGMSTSGNSAAVPPQPGPPA